MTTKEQQFLIEVDRIVQDRRKRYGHPTKNLHATADAWSAYLSGKMKTPIKITATDLCNMMMMLKIMRDANGPLRDNDTDVCGYALCKVALEVEDIPYAPED